VEQNPPRPARGGASFLAYRRGAAAGVADWDHRIAACIKQRLCRRPWSGCKYRISRAPRRKAHLRCRRGRQTAHPASAAAPHPAVNPPNHSKNVTAICLAFDDYETRKRRWFTLPFHGNPCGFSPHSAATRPSGVRRTASNSSRRFAALAA
jgi:hypothetical protein